MICSFLQGGAWLGYGVRQAGVANGTPPFIPHFFSHYKQPNKWKLLYCWSFNYHMCKMKIEKCWDLGFDLLNGSAMESLFLLQVKSTISPLTIKQKERGDYETKMPKSHFPPDPEIPKSEPTFFSHTDFLVLSRFPPSIPNHNTFVTYKHTSLDPMRGMPLAAFFALWLVQANLPPPGPNDPPRPGGPAGPLFHWYFPVLWKNQKHKILWFEFIS